MNYWNVIKWAWRTNNGVNIHRNISDNIYWQTFEESKYFSNLWNPKSWLQTQNRDPEALCERKLASIQFEIYPSMYNNRIFGKVIFSSQ